jgi:hypothetical protein
VFDRRGKREDAEQALRARVFARLIIITWMVFIIKVVLTLLKIETAFNLVETVFFCIIPINVVGVLAYLLRGRGQG